MYEVGKWIWEHRNQPLTWVTVISFLSLVIDKFGRKLITNQLKRLFHVKDKSEFSAYVENQKRIESKIDMMLEERGLLWDADLQIGSVGKKKMVGQQRKSLLQRAVYAPVTIARYFTLLKETYHYQQRRMNMKSKLLSRKFLLALATGILVVLNDGLDLGLDTDTIMYVVGIVATWIIGESAVDARRKPEEIKIGDSGPAE